MDKKGISIEGSNLLTIVLWIIFLLAVGAAIYYLVRAIS